MFTFTHCVWNMWFHTHRYRSGPRAVVTTAPTHQSPPVSPLYSGTGRTSVANLRVRSSRPPMANRNRNAPSNAAAEPRNLKGQICDSLGWLPSVSVRCIQSIELPIAASESVDRA